MRPGLQSEDRSQLSQDAGLTLGRRQLLSLAFGGATLLLGGVGCGSEAGGGALRGFLQPEVVSARRIGRAYLREHPQEAVRVILTRQLASLPGEPGAPRLDDERVAAWLSQSSSADFEAGRTVRVDRWWLSETEARLCALLSLD